jgi:hypothetical protein
MKNINSLKILFNQLYLFNIKYRMKKILFLFIILSTTSILSQFKITGYFDAEIGLTYKISNHLQIELRASDNLKIEFNSELSLLYTLITKKDYTLNFGVGVSTFPFHSKNTAFFESYFLPLQIEITPFKNANNLGFVLESAYHLSKIINSSGTRNSIGIRYIFK